MRIGVDARPLSYQLTGIGLYLKSILDTLQTIDTKNHYFLISNAPINYTPKNPKWVKIEGRINSKYLSTLWMQIWGALLIVRLNLGLFWSPRHHLPIVLPSRIKTVVTIHDIVHHYYPDTMALPNLFVERMLMRYSLIRSNRIITDSQSTASDLIDVYKVNNKKISTICPGIPVLDEGTPDLENQKIELPLNYFLFVGTLEPRKNFYKILKAFELVKPDRNQLNLVIVGGEGWKTDRFIESMKNHPFNSQIHLKGYIPRKNLRVYYEKAIGLLFPSLYEGFGFPILEAMSCGTPVITANISSMPEVAGEAAILVDPNDHCAIADAMVDLFKNKALRNYYKTKGIQRTRQFSWLKCAKKTIQVFDAAISQ